MIEPIKLLATLFLLINSFLIYAQEHATPKKHITPEYLRGEEVRAVQLYSDVLPTVVTIITSRLVFTEERGLTQQESIGSGVLISPDCHILTAAHVVKDAESIIVITNEGERRSAKLLFAESKADIALINFITADPNIKHAKLGNSDSLAVGQMIYVIGNPYGLQNTFSAGHISAFREFNRLYDGTILAEFIQTDAAINSGNSGGPVFNSKGEVIGIASRILTVSGGFQGIGFVVSINTAKQLLSLENRAWMGFDGIFLNKQELVLLFNINQEGGMLIQHVSKGSPADKAGLKGGIIPAKIIDQDIVLGGDLILQFGDQKACHSACLVEVGKHLAGQNKIAVKFLRGGKIMNTVIDVSESRQNFLVK